MPALAFLGLTACGGDASRSLDEQLAESYRLIARAQMLAATPVADVPDSGQATYNGIVGIGVGFEGEDGEFIGDASVTADFGAATVSGSFSNFHEEDGGSLEGNLTLSSGQIIGNGIDADVAGVLTTADESFEYDGNVQGGFGGPNAEMLAGTTYGDVSINGGLPDDFEGAFLAER